MVLDEMEEPQTYEGDKGGEEDEPEDQDQKIHRRGVFPELRVDPFVELHILAFT